MLFIVLSCITHPISDIITMAHLTSYSHCPMSTQSTVLHYVMVVHGIYSPLFLTRPRAWWRRFSFRFSRFRWKRCGDSVRRDDAVKILFYTPTYYISTGFNTPHTTAQPEEITAQ